MTAIHVNRVKGRLAAGEVVTLVMGDYSPDTAELLASSGVDILWGEMEDGTTSWRDGTSWEPWLAAAARRFADRARAGRRS